MIKSLGEYEPRKASILQKTTILVDKEPTGAEVELCKRPIRFVMSRGGGEIQAQGQTRSYIPVVIRMPKDSKTKTIVATAKIIHDGATYEIVSIPPVPNADDEIEFTCKSSKGTK